MSGQIPHSGAGDDQENHPGLLPWLIMDLSYLNWYGFPLAYEIGHLLDQGVGAVLAGVGLAWLMRKEGAVAVGTASA